MRSARNSARGMSSTRSTIRAATRRSAASRCWARKPRARPTAGRRSLIPAWPNTTSPAGRCRTSSTRMTSASLVDRKALQPVVDVGGIYGCGLFATRGESQARGAMTSSCGSSGNSNGVARISLCEAGPRDGEARSRDASFWFTPRGDPRASELFAPPKPEPEERQRLQQSVREFYEWGLNTSDYDRSGVPGGSGAAENGAADHGGPVHLPDRDIAAAVLPQNVGTAVAIVFAGADSVPARAGVRDAAAADHAGAVQLPDRDFAAVVLQQDVRAAVAVEVAGAQCVPVRPRIAETAAGNHRGPVQFPDDDFPAVVLQQDVGEAVAVEIARPPDMPARPGVAETAAADHLCPIHLPDRGFPTAVLPQDIGTAIMVEIADPGDVPARPRIAEAIAANHAGPVGLPDHRLAAVVLQQQVGVAVAVEITRPLDVPIGAGVAQICSTGDRAAIAPPDVGVAAVV